ncbi:hypothetical protein GCM10027062_40400 [Nocardioides hungaricus]
MLVPGALALLPEYAGLEDPVAELRAACERAVGWLGEDVTVLASPQGRRVAEHLLAASSRTGAGRSYLAVGNGSAKRTEGAPGHVDERAVPFDGALGDALATGRLAGLDLGLSEELWADTDAIAALARVLPPGLPATVDLDADPFGVQYWVARWEW